MERVYAAMILDERDPPRSNSSTAMAGTARAKVATVMERSRREPDVSLAACARDQKRRGRQRQAAGL